jgi:hypothetical protein
LEKEVYTYLPDIRKLGIADITEDEFYKLIGLTRQEINQIKNPSSNKAVEQDYELEKRVIQVNIIEKNTAKPTKTIKVMKPKLFIQNLTKV